MHRPYRNLQNLKFSCLYLFPFSHKVVPQKASGGGGGVGGRSRGGGGGSYTTLQLVNIGVATFFFHVSGLKLDEKSIENGLEGQKFLVVCLFWGGCHHPNQSLNPIYFISISISIPLSILSLSPHLSLHPFYLYLHIYDSIYSISISTSITLSILSLSPHLKAD